MKNKMSNNKFLVILIIGITFCLVFVQNSSASIIKLSNESIQAKESLAQAERDISEMIERNIPINQVNESYQETLQLYFAQLALEEKGSKADYKLVMKHTLKISSIKKTSLEANDELKIFMGTFKETEKNTDFSEFEEEYNQIILSFNEERFEDTLNLIDKGYKRISEIQSSQTALNLFYLTTTKTIKNFFKKNWTKLIIICSAIIFFILIFHAQLKKLKLRMQFNHLTAQKKALDGLIKEMQKNYFKLKTISEAEYNIKLKKFKELIREINRKLMVLKEDRFKIKKKK